MLKTRVSCSSLCRMGRSQSGPNTRNTFLILLPHLAVRHATLPSLCGTWARNICKQSPSKLKAQPPCSLNLAFGFVLNKRLNLEPSEYNLITIETQRKRPLFNRMLIARVPGTLVHSCFNVRDTESIIL